jgi:hypothetical protein
MDKGLYFNANVTAFNSMKTYFYLEYSVFLSLLKQYSCNNNHGNFGKGLKHSTE